MELKWLSRYWMDHLLSVSSIFRLRHVHPFQASETLTINSLLVWMLAELSMRVHHRNLVSLVGYCDDGRTVALIYEYMARGDLFVCHELTSCKWFNFCVWQAFGDYIPLIILFAVRAYLDLHLPRTYSSRIGIGRDVIRPYGDCKMLSVMVYTVPSWVSVYSRYSVIWMCNINLHKPVCFVGSIEESSKLQACKCFVGSGYRGCSYIILPLCDVPKSCKCEM